MTPVLQDIYHGHLDLHSNLPYLPNLSIDSALGEYMPEAWWGGSENSSLERVGGRRIDRRKQRKAMKKTKSPDSSYLELPSLMVREQSSEAERRSTRAVERRRNKPRESGETFAFAFSSSNRLRLKKNVTNATRHHTCAMARGVLLSSNMVRNLSVTFFSRSSFRSHCPSSVRCRAISLSWPRNAEHGR